MLGNSLFFQVKLLLQNKKYPDYYLRIRDKKVKGISGLFGGEKDPFLLQRTLKSRVSSYKIDKY